MNNFPLGSFDFDHDNSSALLSGYPHSDQNNENDFVLGWNTVDPFILAGPKVSETGFYPYVAEFNISNLQDAWMFC